LEGLKNMTKLTETYERLAENKKVLLALMRSLKNDQPALDQYAALQTVNGLLSGQVVLLEIDQAEQRLNKAGEADKKANTLWLAAREKSRQAREDTEDKKADIRRFGNSNAAKGTERLSEDALIKKNAELEKIALDAETAEKLARNEQINAAQSQFAAKTEFESAGKALEDLKKRAAGLGL
jgi:hypothetical protein